MADAQTYNSLHCRGVAVDQATGELRYAFPEDEGLWQQKIAQFIGPKPVSEDCDTFSVEITNSGRGCCIGIGLCHKRYAPRRLPGWDIDSIGIYHEYGIARLRFTPVGQGEVMECSFDFTDNTVTFCRNGNQIYTSPPLKIPSGGFYPIIGMETPGESVRLLELEPWSPETGISSKCKEVIFNSLYRREVKVSQITGIVRYQSMCEDTPVGQFVSKCPLSLECNKFSVEVASRGQKSCMSIGACHRWYPSNCQLGWLPNSIAYHIDNGGIYRGSDEPLATCPRAEVGDILSCEFDFVTRSFIFRRNDVMIYHSPPVLIPPGGFHAVVGFHSPGEAVCLIDRQPWRPEEPRLPVQKYHFTTASDVSVDQNSGIFSFKGGTSQSVAQITSNSPLTPKHSAFSIEIVKTGRSGQCSLALGLSPPNGPGGEPSGLVMHCVGCITASDRHYTDISATTKTPSKGDIIACDFNFVDNIAVFTYNGKRIHQTKTLTVPPGGYHAAVWLHSDSGYVRLCESEPWRGEDLMPSNSTNLADKRMLPKCCICIDKGVSRFLIPCGHTFCVDCVEEWTADHKKCPACRGSFQKVKMLYF